jgi:glycosyltransferase involved in cell wall biosynthesis
MKVLPSISIVIPSFNQGKFIEMTLESLFDQEYPSLELIVIDGGSTDGSVEIIKRYSNRLSYWVSEKDRGQSHAINKGFMRASGEWLGWLNSDDLILPNALQILGKCIINEENQPWWIGGGYFINDRGRRFRDFRPPVGLREPNQLNDWSRYWFAQPSTFFSRELFDRAGGFVREDLHYAMDLELWLRFLKLVAPGFIQAEISVCRQHVGGKTHALAIDGEAEIVKVLSEHLGIEAALERIRNLAAERDALKLYCQRINIVLHPLTLLYRAVSRLKRLVNVFKEHRGC